MAFTWALNDSVEDMQISKGRLKIVSGAEEVKQRILVTLWHYWEEYFLNVPAGVPWYELILGSKNKKMVEALLRYAISDVPGVVSVLRLQVQSTSSILRDFAIYIDVEVLQGTVISIFTTSAEMESDSEVQENSYITNQDGTFLTTKDGQYITA